MPAHLLLANSSHITISKFRGVGEHNPTVFWNDKSRDTRNMDEKH